MTELILAYQMNFHVTNPKLLKIQERRGTRDEKKARERQAGGLNKNEMPISYLVNSRKHHMLVF